MPMQRMTRSPVKLAYVVLAAIFSFLPNTSGDTGELCHSRCQCGLTATPQVLCEGFFSLPKYVPQQATSFGCVNCPLPILRGRGLANYMRITNISLEGSSHLEFDEQAIEFHRGVQELHLTGYLMNSGDLLALMSHCHKLVLRNNSLYEPPTTPAPLTSTLSSGGSSDCQPGLHSSTTAPSTTGHTYAGSGSSQLTTSRPDGGNHVTTTLPPDVHDQDAAEEESSLAYWVGGVSFLLSVALLAAVVWACMLRKGRRYPTDAGDYADQEQPLDIQARLALASSESPREPAQPPGSLGVLRNHAFAACRSFWQRICSCSVFKSLRTPSASPA